MAKKQSHKTPPPLPQPVFSEPEFSEGVATPDPTGFLTPHPSDDAQYAAIKKLLDKAVDPAQARFDLVTVDLASHTMVSN
jgi:hypothetical protein